MNKPRILIVENSIAVTGALKSILDSSSELQSDYDFFFIIPKKAQTKNEILKAGFKVEQLNMIEINKRFLSLLFYVPQLFINAIRLKRIVRRLKIDLVHVNDLYNLIPAVSTCLGMKVPYICHVRFLPNRFPRILFSAWVKIQLHFACKVITVSQALKNSLPQHAKITMIYHGFRSKVKLSVRTEEKSAYKFLYLSNFIKGKGQDHALKAFERIHTQIPDWKLRFVGGDMGLEKNKRFLLELRTQALNAGLSEKIEWVGFTENVETEYRSADIVINFSESESFSMTCAEAQYFGIPTIASDSGGPAEIIDHNKTGFLVPNRQIDQMSEAMAKLASDPDLREAMKQNSFIAAHKKFSPEKTSAMLKEVYQLSLQR